MVKHLKIETVAIETVKPNPNNPRTITPENKALLVKSIKDFPQMLELRPLVVDKKGVILGGNMRYDAAIGAGLKKIPIIRAESLTPAQAKEFVVKDNVGFGEWEWEALLEQYSTDDLQEWGLDVPEFAGVDKADAADDGYEIPEDVTTDIAIGDLFEIGHHRLLCGDSTKADTFKTLLDGSMADLVVTDPPYNVDYTGKTKQARKILNDKQDDGAFYQFLYDFYKSLGEYTKAGGAWYVWHADSEGANFRKAMADSGIMVKQCLIWVKSSMVLGRQDYHWKHEPCLYGWKEGAAHGWYSDRKQTTVLEFERPNRNAEHPTMKPVPLFAYQIGNSSKQGDIVADGFGGSGTTMVACHQIGRKAYIVEFDPKYCQVIIDRMLKLDPSLEVKKNGKPYKTGG